MNVSAMYEPQAGVSTSHTAPQQVVQGNIFKKQAEAEGGVIEVVTGVIKREIVAEMEAKTNKKAEKKNKKNKNDPTYQQNPSQSAPTYGYPLTQYNHAYGQQPFGQMYAGQSMPYPPYPQTMNMLPNLQQQQPTMPHPQQYPQTMLISPPNIQQQQPIPYFQQHSQTALMQQPNAQQQQPMPYPQQPQHYQHFNLSQPPQQYHYGTARMPFVCCNNVWPGCYGACLICKIPRGGGGRLF